MVILVILFVFLLLLLLASMPVIFTARMRFSPVGGVIHGTVTLFGAIPIPIRARVRLFSEPFLTLQVFRKKIPLHLPKTDQKPDPRSFRAERIHLYVTLGISNDGARTVQLLGTLNVLASLLLPLLFRNVEVSVQPAFSQEMFRLKAEAIGLVFPLFLFLSHRIKAAKTANHSKKQLAEKRYSHVTG